MKLLFEKINLLFENGEVKNDWYLTTNEDKIEYIGKDRPKGTFDRTINGELKVLMPGFYNCHTHAPMTLLRGYAEDLPLDRWLNEKIFPAEKLLTKEAVASAAMISVAEMIKNGIVSFSDMYYHCDQIVNAVDKSGMKANISYSISQFDKDIKKDKDPSFVAATELFKEYNGFANGRVKIDMCLHSEYTTVPATCMYVSDFAYQNHTNIQLHLSETELENANCIKKYGKTPTQYLKDCGVFRVPVMAAHCVHMNDEDIETLKKYGATVVHNPVSNLKLGSGVIRLKKFLDAGVNIALGSDGPASNNTVDIMKEAYIAAILQKGITGKTDEIKSQEYIKMLTKNGALAQGRNECGELKVGSKADLVMLDFDTVQTLPVYNYRDTFLYSANSSNVIMTMVNGKILYENGEFKTLDIEKVKYDFKNTIANYFK